jgi:hypothetical protein
VSFGRLVRLLAVAAALAAVVGTTAEGARPPVVVIKHRSIRLLAWDSGRKLCTQLVGARQRTSNCSSPRALNFEQFPSGTSKETLVGGNVPARATVVEAVFANGDKLELKTVAGRRYRGRRHGKVRFFAGREPGATTIVSLTARDRSGKTVASYPGTTGTPVPVPKPPPGPPPCSCTPTADTVCPLIACE